MTEIERRFHADMVSDVARLNREIGYNPTRFVQMLADHGGVGAARTLLRGSDASYGFTTLWQHGRLALSVEAFVLLPWYEQLFSEQERDVARDRLEQHDFDVDRFLAYAAERRPAWAVA